MYILREEDDRLGSIGLDGLEILAQQEIRGKK
jgi:hypothetical protein